MRWFQKQKGHSFERKLNEFTHDLQALRPSELTLSRIARDVVDVFIADYCAIHACDTCGGWRNLSGVATASITDCPDLLKVQGDHMAGTLELAEEQELGVRNFAIPCNEKSAGLLVMKCESLSDDQIRAIASTIGERLYTRMISRKQLEHGLPVR